MKEHAARRVELANSVPRHQSYKTLFYGLKKNHPHNVAIIQPLAFVLRRVLYSLIILYMVTERSVFFGALLLQLTCLFFGGLILLEAQWKEYLINLQHFVNEIFFYLICSALMCFGGLINDNIANRTIGWLIIGLTCMIVLFNIGVIVADMLDQVRLIYLRYRHHSALAWRQAMKENKSGSSKSTTCCQRLLCLFTKCCPSSKKPVKAVVVEKANTVVP